MSFSPFTAFLLFPVMVVLLEVGRRLRLRRATEGSNAVEGAVFALFGLLLAFTFSGATARYDRHRQLATEETNGSLVRVDPLSEECPHAVQRRRRNGVQQAFALR